MQNKKEIITLQDGSTIQAQTPIIISASRSTDIPTFYSDWFTNKWNAGYIKWTNPFNGVPLYVFFKNTRCVVFWTKNPRPMFKYLDFLDENIPSYYFQFSLNDYDKEGYEGKVATADLFSDEQTLKTRNLKNKGQREDCGCVVAKDIGAYNTCPHECNYCYANTSKEIAKKNYQTYLSDKNKESII